MLTHRRGGVIRLVLSFLDDPTAASSAITLIAHRSDSRFIECLAHKVGAEPSAAAAANLKKIENIAWLQSEPTILDTLDDAAQVGRLQLADPLGHQPPRRVANGRVICCSRAVLKAASRRGRVGSVQWIRGQRALFASHRRRRSCRASQCAAATAATGIPRTLTRLVEMLESPHEVVRGAIRRGARRIQLQTLPGGLRYARTRCPGQRRQWFAGLTPTRQPSSRKNC